MKTYFYRLFLLVFLGFTFNGWSQNEEDALRYASQEISGTARFTAMSGAFSSLGGDLSAIGLNPAGLTTFSTNRITGTLSFYNTENTASYFGNSHLTEYSSFDDNIISMDQLGVVWVYKSNTSDWNKLAFSLNYNKQADYGNLVRIQGTNTVGNSVVNYFVDQANGVQLGDIKIGTDETTDFVYQWLGENLGFQAQQAFLGYQAYIINPVDDTDDNNVLYTPNADYNTVYHNNKITTTGSKTNFDLSIGGTYKENLQLGFGLSLINIDYTENNTITEDGYNASSDLQFLKFRNVLYTEGSGVQLKFGGIYKLPNNLRLSLAYHTPQWIKIEEYLTQAVHTEFGNGDIIEVNPNVENAFAPYRIITPGKLIAGASMVLGKKGLISADYTYQDYSNLRFKEIEADVDSDYFDNVNNYMNTNFQAVHSFNLGAEMKLSELSLRGGTFVSSSPYKNSETLYANKGYSLGVGFDLGGIVIDGAWIHSENDTYRTLLALPDQAVINQTKNKFLIGVRYDF